MRLRVEARVDEPMVREALDQVIEKLEAIALAQAKLDETGRRWFDQQLRAELERLGNLPRFEARLRGSGAIVQGSGKAGGKRAVVADRLEGIAQTGTVTARPRRKSISSARTSIFPHLRPRQPPASGT